MLPKIKPYRNNEYLRFIRSKPCLKCMFRGSEDNPIIAAHQTLGYWGSTGSKPPDLWTVPLHFKCHTGDCAEHQIGNETFWQGFNLELEVLKLINEFYYRKSQSEKF